MSSDPGGQRASGDDPPAPAGEPDGTTKPRVRKAQLRLQDVAGDRAGALHIQRDAPRIVLRRWPLLVHRHRLAPRGALWREMRAAQARECVGVALVS
jgi:hypothetical protein